MEANVNRRHIRVDYYFIFCRDYLNTNFILLFIFLMPKGHSEARGVGFVNKGQKSIHCPVCPDAEILHRLYVYVECCVLRVHISCVCVGYSIYVHVLCCVCVFVCVCNLPLLSLPTMNPFRQTIAIIVLWNRLYRLNRLSCSFSLIISQNCKNFNFSTNYTLRREIKIYMLNHTRLSLNNNQKKMLFFWIFPHARHCARRGFANIFSFNYQDSHKRLALLLSSPFYR